MHHQILHNIIVCKMNPILIDMEGDCFSFFAWKLTLIDFFFHQPSWTIVDPICTFIFCILVLISTLNVLKDALRVLMEGKDDYNDKVSVFALYYSVL